MNVPSRKGEPVGRSATARPSRWVRIRAHLPAPRRIRPTRAGLAFIGTTLAVGFAALNTGNNLLYLVLSMMLSMIAMSGILSELSIRRLQVRRLLPPRPVAGAPARGALVLRNPRRWLAAVAVWIEAQDQAATVTPCFFVAVPAGTEQRRPAIYRFQRRGRHRLEALWVRTTYPFGLFSRSFRLDLSDEVLVYPPLETVALEPVGSPHEHGDRVEQRKGGGDDFFGLRAYVQGDDPRRIHWRSTAKRGETLVREDACQERRRAVIRLELANPLPEEGTYERGLVLVVSHAAALLAEGFQVAVDMPGVTVPFDGGAVQRRRILRAAALAPRYAEAAELPIPEVRWAASRSIRVVVEGRSLDVEVRA